MKFLNAGSDFMDRFQSWWSGNTKHTILPFIGILGLLMEDSNRLRRLQFRYEIVRSQLINNHHLPDQSPEITCREITGRCISFIAGVQ